ncbi:hypothetical protein F2P56_035063 [Juglans regia]|uniref:Uncharacterized protein LOC109012525 n=2 Tax=Juglans regia TaxID=51240 RepID=A0A2I4H0V8_JUGRE|nr:uncharacterized protein LOC109012525 [Juglans regia]KAF5442404.1 hypothetical protein F2P56_035063 [Juglans regia]
MTETKAVVKCSIVTVVGFLGIVSFAAGFAAEVTRVKASQVRITRFSGCVYPSSPAMALGLVAAVALLIAQIIINFSAGFRIKLFGSSLIIDWPVTKYLRIKAGQHELFTLSFKFDRACRITFVAGFILLLAGAALNNEHDGESSYYSGYNSCYVVKPGVFAGGAILSIVTVILGINYYLTLISSNNSNIMNNPSGNPSATYQGGQGETAIAMGQPQFPPKSTQLEPVGP